MKKSDKYIHLDWLDVKKMCKKIALKLKSLNFTPDLIITPLRGGAVPAVILSHMINIPLITINAYRTLDDSIEAKRRKVSVSKLPTKDEVENKNVLIFDEIADSGETLQKVYSKILRLKPKKIITAVIFTNSKRFQTKFRKPDISLKEVDRWVVFPWE